MEGSRVPFYLLVKEEDWEAQSLSAFLPSCILPWSGPPRPPSAVSIPCKAGATLSECGGRWQELEQRSWEHWWRVPGPTWSLLTLSAWPGDVLS